MVGIVGIDEAHHLSIVVTFMQHSMKKHIGSIKLKHMPTASCNRLRNYGRLNHRTEGVTKVHTGTLSETTYNPTNELKQPSVTSFSDQ